MQIMSYTFGDGRYVYAFKIHQNKSACDYCTGSCFGAGVLGLQYSAKWRRNFGNAPNENNKIDGLIRG